MVVRHGGLEARHLRVRRRGGGDDGAAEACQLLGCKVFVVDQRDEHRGHRMEHRAALPPDELQDRVRADILRDI